MFAERGARVPEMGIDAVDRRLLRVARRADGAEPRASVSGHVHLPEHVM